MGASLELTWESKYNGYGWQPCVLRTFHQREAIDIFGPYNLRQQKRRRTASPPGGRVFPSQQTKAKYKLFPEQNNTRIITRLPLPFSPRDILILPNKRPSKDMSQEAEGGLVDIRQHAYTPPPHPTILGLHLRQCTPTNSRQDGRAV